jgi:toxin secretion/phage lysis holin
MDQFHSLVNYIIVWAKGIPLVGTLLVLIHVDIFTGILVAANRKTLNSTISFRGITRKVFMLIFVGVASTLEPFANGLPLAQLVAMGYIVTESISILENGAALGVPIPKILTDILVKLREDQQKRTEQKVPAGTTTTTTTVTVPINPGTTEVVVSRDVPPTKMD